MVPWCQQSILLFCVYSTDTGGLSCCFQFLWWSDRQRRYHGVSGAAKAGLLKSFPSSQQWVFILVLKSASSSHTDKIRIPGNLQYASPEVWGCALIFSTLYFRKKKIQTYKTVGKESIMNTSVIFTWIHQMLPHLLLPSLSLPSPLTLPASWEYRVFWFILLNHLKVTCRHNFSSLRLQHDSPKNNNILLLLSGVNIFRSFLE